MHYAFLLAANVAAFTVGQPPSPEFMVGIWGEGKKCEFAVNFQADGTIMDGPFDKWEIRDGQLVLGGSVRVKLTVVDDKTMQALPEEGTEPRTIRRCDLPPAE